MNPFNLFKKAVCKEILPKPITMTINNSEYTIDGASIKVQSTAEDVQVYGWTLEQRYKYNNEWSSWHTHYNHRIYNSKESAIDASIKIGNLNHEEFRITPLYKMSDPQYREYKIDKILNNSNTKKTYEIKGWRLKEDYDYFVHPTNGSKYTHKKGSVFIQLENGRIIKSGNFVDPTYRTGITPKSTTGTWFDTMIKNGFLEEIEIKDEKWLHPHLLKGLKNKLK